jgi:methyl-accepting chemotaxis protein
MSQEDAQKAAKDALRVSRYGGPDGKTEYFYIWTLDSGRDAPHQARMGRPGHGRQGQGREGTDILKTISDALKASKDGRVFVPTMFARPGQQALVPKLQYVIRVDGWNWMVGSGLYTDDIDALVRKTLLADLVLVLVVWRWWAVWASPWRARCCAKSGQPSEAIGIMSQVAQGNLDTQIPNAYPGSMLDGLAHMVTSLRRLVTEVRSATDNIATASTEIAQANNDLARRTEEHGQQPADHGQQHGRS